MLSCVSNRRLLIVNRYSDIGRGMMTREYFDCWGPARIRPQVSIGRRSMLADRGAPQIEATPYNQGNCQFAAEVLNADLRRVAAEQDGEPNARFWCEPGRFRP